MGGRPVMMIGLDAFDPELALAWAADGQLPALARLLDQGARATVRNPYGLFVGALWASFASALRPERHLYHCWDEIEIPTYRWRLSAPKPERYEPFWRQIGQAGRRVAAIDVPHARAAPVNGLELFEYGCHDRHYGLHSAPPGRAAELAGRFGFHPVLGIDPWRERHFAPDDFVARKGRYRRLEEEAALTRAMCEGAAAKGRLVEALAAEEDWDLFIAVFGESHAIGHQQWHLHDERHPRFDAAARDAAGGDPILLVYREIDAALGRLAEAAPREADLLVHLSHGMTAHHDGTHLLDEVLARLDGVEMGGGARRAVRPVLPALQHLAAKARVPPRVRSAIGQALRGDHSRARARRRFFAEPNNSVYGGIRFNLVGREPQGCVRPDETEALARELERDLMALVNVETGGPVVLAVEPCERHHRRAADDTMPDLFVEWERSAPVEAVVSPRTGLVRTRYTHWRTGDHKPDGLLIARGAGFPAGAVMPDLAVEDLGPSVASRLGVALEDVDGSAALWLAGPAAAVAA